jgi:hypothetical protein
MYEEQKLVSFKPFWGVHSIDPVGFPPNHKQGDFFFVLIVSLSDGTSALTSISNGNTSCAPLAPHSLPISFVINGDASSCLLNRRVTFHFPGDHADKDGFSSSGAVEEVEACKLCCAPMHLYLKLDFLPFEKDTLLLRRRRLGTKDDLLLLLNLNESTDKLCASMKKSSTIDPFVRFMLLFVLCVMNALWLFGLWMR